MAEGEGVAASIEGELGIRDAELVLPCTELDPNLNFFTESLGFRIEAIFPADAPSTAVISGHGLRLRLEARPQEAGPPLTIRLNCRHPKGRRSLTAPCGVTVTITDADPALVLPPLQATRSLVRMQEGAWISGRAGMLYRDLIPDRQGGRFIASHIRIPDGGPVPDYVHFHKIRFQMIYCARGWVRVVYQDQGPPFAMEAGDCVLQPPGIRHRVLESSPGLEVIEIGCPAEHETRADHALELPNEDLRPDRRFEGQAFVRHRAAEEVWKPTKIRGLQARDTGIADATDGLAGARVLRPDDSGESPRFDHAGEFHFLFVLAGSARLGESERIVSGDALTLAAGETVVLQELDPDLEVLEVRLPSH